MKIIKEFKPSIVSEREGERIRQEAVGIVTSNVYGLSVGLLDQLIEAAREDFPYIDRDSIRIVCYGGEWRGGMYGIEFDLVGVGDAPEGWAIIHKLEKVI